MNQSGRYREANSGQVYCFYCIRGIRYGGRHLLVWTTPLITYSGTHFFFLVLIMGDVMNLTVSHINKGKTYGRQGKVSMTLILQHSTLLV